MKLKGLAMYPKLQPGKYDTKFEETWTVDVLLDKEGLKEAKAAKLRIKKTHIKDGEAVVKYAGMFEGYDGSYIKLKRSVKDFKGIERDPPKLIDSKLQPIGPRVEIGNGSLINAQFIVKADDAETVKKYGGFGTFLLGVQVLKLVAYEGRAADPEKEFVEEDGEELSGSSDFVATDDLDEVFGKPA